MVRDSWFTNNYRRQRVGPALQWIYIGVTFTTLKFPICNFSVLAIVRLELSRGWLIVLHEATILLSGLTDMRSCFICAQSFSGSQIGDPLTLRDGWWRT